MKNNYDSTLLLAKQYANETGFGVHILKKGDTYVTQKSGTAELEKDLQYGLSKGFEIIEFVK